MNDLEASAREAAQEATVLFEASLFRGVCSRAYYASFNAARAMLLARGLFREQAKTHKTVLRLFSREFVQNGTFDKDLARALRKSADARHMADYEGGVTREEAAEIMAALEGIMAKAEEVLSTLKAKDTNP